MACDGLPLLNESFRGAVLTVAQFFQLFSSCTKRRVCP